MNRTFENRRQMVLNGVSAIAKMFVLIVGVPLALIRLWYLAPVNASMFRPNALHSATTWARLLVLVIVILWLFATARLVHEIFLAVLRKQDRPIASWSMRWAAQIAGLLFLATTSSVLASQLPTAKYATPSHIALRLPSQRQPASDSVTPRAAIDNCLLPSLPTMDRTATPTSLTSQVHDVVPLPAVPTDSSFLQWCFGKDQQNPAQYLAQTSIDGHHSLNELWIALEIFGAGALIVTSLARRLRGLRNLAASSRMPLEHRKALPLQIAKTDAYLRSFVESPIIEWLEIANRLLWKVLRERHRTIDVPDIRLVRCGPKGVEFLLATPSPLAPLPFVSATDGYWWTLELGDSAEDWRLETLHYGRYLPSLIPVGQDESATYLVPIGPTRTLGIVGEDQVVDGVLRALLLSLRTLPWANELEIELLGPSTPPLLERSFHLHGSNAAILKDLSRSARHWPRDRLNTDWSREPLVVFDRETLALSADIELEKLTESAGIIAAGQPGTETLFVHGALATLAPYGIELSAPMLTPDESDLADSLLAHAGTPSVAKPWERETHIEQASTTIPEQGTTEVRLLCGYPTLDHVGAGFSEPMASRITELVAFLALHNRTATIDEVARAIFATKAPVPRPQVANLCAAARHALGLSNDRRNRLSLSQDGEVRLDQSVTVDWHRFDEAARSARSLQPDQASSLLRNALELVQKGPILQIRFGYRWLFAEGFSESIEESIIDAAHHLATLSMATGDANQAAWAIARARSVAATSEILVRDAMSIYEARGDFLGLEAAYSSLERELAELNSEPSIETSELFQALRHKTENQNINMDQANDTREVSSLPDA